ncbi:hypothetical protein NDU88_002980 [Pleurodeles waltl]|uniref:Uncharacterized protein n=1 Tax=Pleurodeles waltl TaxID=8319 RepID=A0AAV7P9X7_PLEWA|nr:hypothetical protein NDU88_002980 [Pleurodeles waltl]
MSDPSRILDVRLLQVRTLLHASSEAIRSCGCRRRPGSPWGALLPSSQETGLSDGSAAPLAAGDRGTPSGVLLPSSQETGLSVGSTAPPVAGDRALRQESCPLVAEDRALRRERCSLRRRRPGLSVGSAALLIAGGRALRRERCSPRRGRPGSPSGALLPSSQENGLSVGSAEAETDDGQGEDRDLHKKVIQSLRSSSRSVRRGGHLRSPIVSYTCQYTPES